ncbi:MAG: hypothetical protein JWM63_1637 [Gammaproteobacteria bacterium]|jgi:hypothetical protein|nr:hypothetical protein [Gammaproteobacteria bacterium]
MAPAAVSLNVPRIAARRRLSGLVAMIVFESPCTRDATATACVHSGWPMLPDCCLASDACYKCNFPQCSAGSAPSNRREANSSTSSPPGVALFSWIEFRYLRSAPPGRCAKGGGPPVPATRAAQPAPKVYWSQTPHIGSGYRVYFPSSTLTQGASCVAPNASVSGHIVARPRTLIVQPTCAALRSV